MSQRAILFPGQGAQFVGMSADLKQRHESNAAMFDRASELLGEDLWEICLNGSEDKLNSTVISQPAIFVVSLATVNCLRAANAKSLDCMGTAGLSLGEYSSLVFAGALDFDAAIEIVVRRGQFMQEACDRVESSMTSILGLDLTAVKDIVSEASSEGIVAVSNVNSPKQTVISGELPALARASELAIERGARKAMPLKVAGAYHSPLMATATEKLLPLLQKIEIQKPTMPFYPNVTAQQVSEPEEIRQGLIQQIESAVLFEPSLNQLLQAGMESILEVGPGRVVAGLVRAIDRRMPVSSVLTQDSQDKFIESL